MISRRQETFLNILKQRITDEANYIISTRCTIRHAAKKFMVSKSTVYKDMQDRLPHVDHELYAKVKDILNINKSERHLRGGYAIHIKYLREE